MKLSAEDRAALIRELLTVVQPDSGLIPSLVHGSDDLHALELQRVFQQNWLYLAHESEVPNPGDFVTRQMGQQSVILARGKDGVLRTFLNVCPHRAMRLCSEDAGTRQVFRCPYHGFTFVNDGTLSGAPFRKDAYPGGLDAERLRLSEVRTESYAQLVFGTFQTDGPSLEDFLGPATWYLDLVVGRAEMEVVGGPQTFVVPTPWKVPAENFIADAYHTATAHSFLAKLKLTEGFDFGKDGFHVVPKDGHGLGIGLQEDGAWYPPEVADEVADRLDPDQRALMDRVKNLHGGIYPNLAFLIPNVLEVHGRRVTGTTLRVWQPHGPRHTRVCSWLLVEKNAADDWKQLVRRTHLVTFGASGMLEQDDTEIWSAVGASVAGLEAFEDPWYLDYTMGEDAPRVDDFAGPGEVFAGKFSEESARGFYRKWLSDIAGDEGANHE